jgi:hypothetical protein
VHLARRDPVKSLFVHAPPDRSIRLRSPIRQGGVDRAIAEVQPGAGNHKASRALIDLVASSSEIEGISPPPDGTTLAPSRPEIADSSSTIGIERTAHRF